MLGNRPLLSDTLPNMMLFPVFEVNNITLHVLPLGQLSRSPWTMWHQGRTPLSRYAPRHEGETLAEAKLVTVRIA